MNSALKVINVSFLSNLEPIHASSPEKAEEKNLEVSRVK